MKKQVLTAAAVVCVMLFASARPARAVVYTYDFDNGRITTGKLVGQDNWGGIADWPNSTGSGGTVSYTAGPNPTGGTGHYISQGTTWMYANRTNDPFFYYSLAGTDRFTIEYDMQGGMYGSVTNWFALSENASWKLWFGCVTGADKYGINWTQETGNMWSNAPHHVMLDVVLNSGDGNWYATMHSDGAPVPGLTSFNLGAITPATWNGIYVAQSWYGKMDSFQITVPDAVVPEPGGPVFLLLGLGGMARLRRRT